MKNLLQLLFLFFITTSSLAQSQTERMTGILNQIGKSTPADQLFLHVDRNIYHAGDTIRFQAYIRDSRTGAFETESSTLYALLLNSNHETIDSARFRIIFPTVSGWLKVPDDTPAGEYSILAFTSIDMNYSPEFAFSTPVRIENFLHLPNGIIGKSEENTISSNFPLLQPAPDLRFMPEGGSFIYGIQQRVAFNAVSSDGGIKEVAGIIENQLGEKITDFRSTQYGPGVVEFTPLPGDTYFATLTGEEFKDLKWSLPVPKSSGVAMRVDNTGSGLEEIILKGIGIAGRSYYLTVTMNNILVLTEEVRLDSLFRKRIQSNKLPSGTAFVTLYDPELNPVAERLIFLNDYKKLNVKIGVASQVVNQGDETELTIGTTDNKGLAASSVVSLAVIDSASGYDVRIPAPEIESACLYDKDFYNNLPSRIKSRGLKNLDNKSMDLFLMTYGWRKFTLKEIAQGIPEKELVDYDYLKIINPGPWKKGRSDIKLISIEGLDSMSLSTNDVREAILPFDSLDPGVRQIMILPDKDPVKNTNPVIITFPETNDFTAKAKLLAIYPGYLAPDVPFISNRLPDPEMDSVIYFKPVTIKGKKQFTHAVTDKFAKMYQYAATTTMVPKRDFDEASNFEDIIYRFNPYYVDKVQQMVYLRTIEYIKGAEYDEEKKTWSLKSEMMPALIVVDNTEIGNSFETIAIMPCSQISSVTFMKGIQGFARFGPKAIGGVVFVTTKMADTNGNNNNEGNIRKDDLMKPVRLFRTETEFYIPAKEEVATKPEFQSRSTILWKGHLFIDESGSVKIRYPNNPATGTVMVFVNGISFTNLIGSNSYTYKVR